MTSTQHGDAGTGTGRPASDSGTAPHQGSENPHAPQVTEDDLDRLVDALTG